MDILKVSSSPHQNAGLTTQKVMLTVLIALFPALAASTVLFGWKALALTAETVAACVGFEYLFRKLLHRDNTIGDLSAAVTGVILAFNLPATMMSPSTWWMPLVGAFAAIVVTKEFFGGLGQNFANPAIVGRIVMMLSFTAAMTNFVTPAFTDAVTSATPLAAEAGTYSLTDLLFGLHGGTLGETCAVALLLGLVILLVTKTISPIIPVCFIGTYFAAALIDTASVTEALMLTLSGGLLFGAIFMATDYVTSPVTKWGRVIFAVGCGLLTFVIRRYAAMNEGVSFAILVMNLLVPHIERLTTPKPFGTVKEKKGAKAK